MEYKSIQVNKDTYDKLVELSDANGRSIKGQIDVMVNRLSDPNISRLLFDDDYREYAAELARTWLEQSRQAMVERLERSPK